jgi:hypothetical protein
MTNVKARSNDQITNDLAQMRLVSSISPIRYPASYSSRFVIPSPFGIRHLSFINPARLSGHETGNLPGELRSHYERSS